MRKITTVGLAHFLALALLWGLWPVNYQAKAAPAAGYLEAAELPDSLNFLPPPPVDDSPDFNRDISVYWRTRIKRDDELWLKASADADYVKNWTTIFQESFGLAIDRKTLPALYDLMDRSATDVETLYNQAKDKFQRLRPFVYFNQPFGTTCLPAEEGSIRNNGSYPSGQCPLLVYRPGPL
jgi:acid phosphatase (class A)